MSEVEDSAMQEDTSVSQQEADVMVEGETASGQNAIVRSEDNGSVEGEPEQQEETVPKKRVRAPRKPANPGEEPAPRMPGTTLFPISKVSKIIKADKDVQMCQKEAVFLISCATEHFVKRLTDAAYTRARIEKRGKSVLYKDLAAVCSAEIGIPSEYFYLEDVVPKQTQNTLKTTSKKKTEVAVSDNTAS